MSKDQVPGVIDETILGIYTGINDVQFPSSLRNLDKPLSDPWRLKRSHFSHGCILPLMYPRPTKESIKQISSDRIDQNVTYICTQYKHQIP